MANIANASGTSDVTLMTAGTSGSKVTGIYFSSTHGANIAVQVAISNGSVDFILTTLSVLANAGHDGTTAAHSLFANSICPQLAVDNDGQPYLFVPPSNTITIKAASAVGTGNVIYAVANYGDF